MGRNTNPSPYAASGVLVASEWVLTAGHIATLGSEKNHEWLFGGQTYKTRTIVLHPRYATSSPRQRFTEGIDLALVRLDRPVIGVAPVTIATSTPPVGERVVLVSHGATGDGQSGTRNPIQQERLAGESLLHGAGGTFGELTLSAEILLTRFDAPPQTLNLAFGVSWGDSGGGLFAQRNGAWELIAIQTAVVPPDGRRESGAPWSWRYGQIAAYVRVAGSREWIETTIRSTR